LGDGAQSVNLTLASPEAPSLIPENRLGRAPRDPDFKSLDFEYLVKTHERVRR